MPAPSPARAPPLPSHARAPDLSSPQSSVASLAQSYGPLASRTPYRLSLPGQEPAIPEAAEEAPAEAPPHAPFGASIFKRDHGAAVPVPPSHAAMPAAASSSAPAALNRSSSNSSAGTPSKRTQRMSVKDRMALFQGPR